MGGIAVNKFLSCYGHLKTARQLIAKELMKIHHFIEAVQAGRVNITLHARKEAREDLLRLDEIFFSVRHGEIIENYPDDFPYPSCLIYGKTSSGDPSHSVWGYDSESRIAS